MKQTHLGLDSLVQAIHQITDDSKGCPWLIKRKSHKALRPYLIEEAYETSEAIESGDSSKICDELGDILLQVLLHSKIAEEKKNFTLLDVMKNLEEKMIRRHPHIFCEKNSQLSLEEIEKQWDLIKESEQKGQKKNSWIKELSKNYPATNQAKKLGKKSEKIGFDWKTADEVFEKFESEIVELKESLEQRKENPQHVKEEIGDVYFTLAQLCRHLDLDPEETAYLGNEKFSKRMEKLEKLSGEKTLEERTQKELEAFWSSVKLQKG